MKHRILVFILCAALLLPCLVFPASAAEGDFTFQVLDYSLPNGGTTRSINITSGASVYFDLPQSATYYYVDMLIRSDTDLNSVICDANGISLTVQKINDNSASLYRVYGDINGWTLSRISFSFHFTTGSALIFESFQISTLRFVLEDVPYIAQGAVPGSEESIDFSISYPGDSKTFLTGYSGIPDPDDWFCYIQPSNDDWKKFDYIDILFQVSCGEINSISSVFYVPMEVSYLSDPDIYRNDFLVNIRLDLTNIDRNDFFPVIHMTGCVCDGVCSWGLISVQGSYAAAEPSPWMYWFGKLGGWISDQTAAIHSWGSSIVNSISTWGQNIVNAITGGETDTSAADTLKEQGQQMQQYEQSHQAVLENGVSVMQQGGNISNFATSLAFVGTYTTSVFNALGDYQIIFTLPLTIGLILFMASRVRGFDKPHKQKNNSAGESKPVTKETVKEA